MMLKNDKAVLAQQRPEQFPVGAETYQTRPPRR
jgi:hypothetical protein